MRRTHISRSRPTRTSRTAVEPLESRVLFAAGSVDPTFSGDGVATFDHLPTDDDGDVVVQFDGKVVVVGTTDFADSDQEDFLVVRFNANGSLDTTFGGGDGFVVTDFSGNRDSATGVEILSDGSILVVGASDDPDNFEPPNWALARYTSAGALDTRFGGDGLVTLDVIGAAYDVELAPDGKATLVGESDHRFAVARVNAGGTPDLSFGTGGSVTTDFNFSLTRANSVAFAPGGKIVAAGEMRRDGLRRGVVARYLPNGQLDTSFSGDGKFYVESDAPELSGVVVQPDGKIVVSDRGFRLRRIRAGGGYDLSFGNTGVATVPVVTAESEIPFTNDLDQQPDGKLILTGNVLSQGPQRDGSTSYVARLTPSGALDSTFGDGGVVAIEGRDGEVQNAMHYADVAPYGKVVVVGTEWRPAPGRFDTASDIIVRRFFGDAPEPPPPAGPWVVQAEDVGRPLHGTVVAASHRGYTGSGYLDFVNNDGAFAQWIVNDIPGPGLYSIEFRYANGSALPRQMAFDPDPAQPAMTLSFGTTGSWSTWHTLQVSVTMLEGSSALPIFLGTTGQNGPNIDRITVTYTPLQNEEPLELQAEQASLVGARVSRGNAGFSGTGYADFTNASGDSIEWTFERGPGVYDLVFRYANGSASDRPLELSVDGFVMRDNLSFVPTGSWSTWREVHVEIELDAGNHRVRLATIGRNGANIDMLTVR